MRRCVAFLRLLLALMHATARPWSQRPAAPGAAASDLAAAAAVQACAQRPRLDCGFWMSQAEDRCLREGAAPDCRYTRSIAYMLERCALHCIAHGRRPSISCILNNMHFKLRFNTHRCLSIACSKGASSCCNTAGHMCTMCATGASWCWKTWRRMCAACSAEPKCCLQSKAGCRAHTSSRLHEGSAFFSCTCRWQGPHQCKPHRRKQMLGIKAQCLWSQAHGLRCDNGAHLLHHGLMTRTWARASTTTLLLPVHWAPTLLRAQGAQCK